MGPQGSGISITTEKDRQIRRLEVLVQAYTALVQERARAAEMERDDMRAAVNELADRVSVSKDFSAWPCAQLRATSFLDPAELLPTAQAHAKSRQKRDRDPQGRAGGVLGAAPGGLAGPTWRRGKGRRRRDVRRRGTPDPRAQHAGSRWKPGPYKQSWRVSPHDGQTQIPTHSML
ncbi:hypothetical protein IW262DRAFT_658488 [Armillaria fumosa]|nr:hypothetical protein IW262DRAFT_658488 [Armillaria fumosa]